MVMRISASVPSSHEGSLRFIKVRAGSEHHTANNSRNTGAGKGVFRGAWATSAGHLSIRIRVRAGKKRQQSLNRRSSCIGAAQNSWYLWF